VSHPPDVLFATSEQYASLGDDEVPVIAALERAGLRAAPAVWTDPAVDWASARIVVVRYVFDYPNELDRFLSWVDRVSATTPLHNPARLIRWNSRKTYLRELEAHGVPIIPTVWIDEGSGLDLDATLEERGWTDAVLKPAVGNGARGAHRVRAGSVGDARRHAEDLLRRTDLMIQPYLRATEHPGERALIHFGGRFSHAISKDQMLAGRPFSFERTPRVDPDPRELALAERVLGLIPESPLLYARVDTVVDGDTVRLMELELIEPVLFFQKQPGSVERFVAAIEERIPSGSS
jgi:hypothetical protein